MYEKDISDNTEMNTIIDDFTCKNARKSHFL